MSWAELFFDLVFVFAVTEVSTRLGHDHDGFGLLRALVTFVPIYWLWVGTAVQTNLRDIGRPGLRLAVFGVALSGLFMALAIPYAFEGRGVLFALAYWAGRLVMGLPILRYTRSWNPYTVSMIFTGPVLLIGALLPAGAQLVLWTCAAALDLSTPSILRSRLSGMRYDAGHLSERFGLFVLIALGESVVGIGLAAQEEEHLRTSVGFAVAAAFALTCGIWWVYFNYAADAVRHSLATAKVQLDITRLVLSYGHLSFIATVIAIAVGLRDAVASPLSELGWYGSGFLFGGTAMYLATFGYTRWMMFRLVSTTRLTAACVVLLLLPIAAYLPRIASLILLAFVLAVLNVVEWLRVTKTGWRAALAGRKA